MAAIDLCTSVVGRRLVCEKVIKDAVPAARKSCQQKVSFVVSDTLFLCCT